MEAVALVVVDLGDRRIDRDLVEVGAAQAQQLRVEVAVVAALQQRVVAEVDAGETCWVQNATCSVSAKKLSGLRLSTSLPTGAPAPVLPARSWWRRARRSGSPRPAPR
jgi:hypothetical protein